MLHHKLVIAVFLFVSVILLGGLTVKQSIVTYIDHKHVALGFSTNKNHTLFLLAFVLRVFPFDSIEISSRISVLVGVFR